MSIFSVPGVRMMPESPFQLTTLNNYKHLYYRKVPSNQRHSSCEKASPEPEQGSAVIARPSSKNVIILNIIFVFIECNIILIYIIYIYSFQYSDSNFLTPIAFLQTNISF